MYIFDIYIISDIFNFVNHVLYIILHKIML